MRELKGRTAFITGGASGIGFGMAQVFGREGMRIALADIEPAPLAAAAAALAAEGIEALSLELDVTDR